jgi:hypothetical protein
MIAALEAETEAAEKLDSDTLRTSELEEALLSQQQSTKAEVPTLEATKLCTCSGKRRLCDLR